MMKYLLSILAILPLLGSCSRPMQNPRAMNPATAARQTAIDEIREADRNFSLMSEREGMAKAFTTYASNDVVKLNDGAMPTIGFDSLRAQMSRQPGTSSMLTWQVLKVDAAISGDLGYTFGEWLLTGYDESGKHTARNGVYVTIWKRQRNGQWRFVVDGGNQIGLATNLPRR